MPKAMEKMARKLKRKKDVDNPFALATYLTDRKKKRKKKAEEAKK
jgi:hypothetical protein